MTVMSVSSNNDSRKITEALNGLIKKLKFLEEHREKSFKFWQYDETENCSLKKMAEAGFYYSGASDEDDSATCFVCGKVLDGWENTDNPWSEHQKHAPNCYFVKLHLTQAESTVEQFFNLAAIIIKNYSNNLFTKKMTAIKNRVEEITSALKSQQL